MSEGLAPNAPPHSSRLAAIGRGRWAALLTLIALSLIAIAYAGSIANPFHFDDSHSVQANAYIRSFHHVAAFFTDVTVFSPLKENRSYRPILLFTYAISHALGGGAPWGYHVVTLLFHLAGTLVAGAIAQRLVVAGGLDRGAARVAAVAAAALLAVHPLLSEAVNYISARSTLQAAVLMLISFYAYVRSRESARPAPWMIASNAILLLALGTKIIAMTAPALIVVWELLVEPALQKNAGGPDLGSTWRERLRGDGLRAWAIRIGPPILLAIGFTLLHEALLGSDVRQARSEIGRYSYFLTETRALLHYLAQFVWPEDLSADLLMRWSEHAWEGETARAILFHLALIGAALASARRFPGFAFGVVWYYVTLSPTSSIAPLSEPATEHRVYIAAPGIVWALVSLAAPGVRALAASRRRTAAVAAVAALVIALLTTRTILRNRVWSSDLELWRDVVERSPQNGRAHLNYGLALMDRGDLEGARRELDRCAKEWPGYVFCYINKAVLALREGRQTDAEQEIASAESLQPRNVYVNQWRGEVELAAKRFPLAEAAYRRTLEIAPGYVEASRGLARSLFEQGKTADARAVLEALERDGELNADGWYALGYLAQEAQDPVRAASSYLAALRYDPRHRRARYNLGVLYHSTGKLTQAIEQYELLALEPNPAGDTLFNLATALWAKGDLGRARAIKERLERESPSYPGLASLKF